MSNTVANPVIVIAIKDITFNAKSLREVDPKSPKVVELAQNIKKQGILLDPVVTDNGDGTYELVDGAHRVAAAKLAGITEIQVKVVEKGAGVTELLARQISTNSTSIPTKPVEYATALKRMIQEDPTTTVAQMASTLGKTEEWVRQILKLADIENEEARDLVNAGQISLNNACMLAKLPAAMQGDYVRDALNADAATFNALVNTVKNKIRADAAAGRTSNGEVEFAPVVKRRSQVEIEAKLKIAGGEYAEALQWVLSMDAESVAKQRADFEAAKVKREEDKKKREAQRQADKEAQAKANLTKLT